jgi:hypothetical protein
MTGTIIIDAVDEDAAMRLVARYPGGEMSLLADSQTCDVIPVGVQEISTKVKGKS